MTTTQAQPTRGLEQRVQRLKDLRAIAALTSRYLYYTAAFASDELLSTFAQSTDDVTVEIDDWGVYEGLDGVRKALLDTLAASVTAHDQGLRQASSAERADPKAGMMLENALTTPVLQVAEDGQTAKGLWMVMGAESAFDPSTDAIGAKWTWVYLAVDFVREGSGDDGWKIWHLRVAPRWRTDYSKSWATTATEGAAAATDAASPPSDRPPSDRPPSDRPPSGPRTDYAVDQEPRYDLRAPEPYATFHDTFSY